MTEKAPDAFRTISEVASELDLPQHVLRFWETKFSQIRPLKQSSGRRFYRRDDVVLLRAIRDKLHQQGYTIRGVQRLLKEQGARGLVVSPDASGLNLESVTHQADAYPDNGDGLALSDADAVSSARSTMHAAFVHDVAAIRRELQLCVALLEDAHRH